jgi:hypothetical protein
LSNILRHPWLLVPNTQQKPLNTPSNRKRRYEESL